MAEAKNGDTVHVHYTGKLDNGTVFASSHNYEPLKFTIGENQLISAFENTVVGMNPGESRTIKIPADEAYGPRSEELVVLVERAQFPENIEPQVGMELEIHQGDEMAVPVTVTDVSESSVTLDANHPLAGEDLTFDIELVEIV
ncbi:MAG TPA: peptidylprolyl isomerase [Dehalococcoidia bacterium]|nr:peptidylprolyl isomerase [Dehalococcoidia bacterium]